jgi:hypothetical protein
MSVDEISVDELLVDKLPLYQRHGWPSAFWEQKYFFFYFEKRSSLLQSWRCSCKFKSRRIGSRSRETF